MGIVAGKQGLPGAFACLKHASAPGSPQPAPTLDRASRKERESERKREGNREREREREKSPERTTP